MLISILPLARTPQANLEPNAISRYCNTAIREVQQVFPLISSHPPPPSDNERSWSRHRARVRRGRGGMEHRMVGNVDGKGEVRECMGCWVEGGGWRAKDRSYAGVTGCGGEESEAGITTSRCWRDVRGNKRGMQQGRKRDALSPCLPITRKRTWCYYSSRNFFLLYKVWCRFYPFWFRFFGGLGW